jgi:DNA-binding CsgD family transcriptional regulator
VEVLVGRARELADFEDALAQARAGRGALLLVSGPPGIGKSRLVGAALDRADALGLRRAAGAAVDDPGAPPLWPWRRVLRAVDGEDVLDRPADRDEPEATARFRLFAEVTDRLAAAAPLLVVLEDAHWADELSAALLRHVAGELAGRGIVVAVTYRDGVPGPLAGVLGNLVRGDGVRLIGLGELTEADVAEWLPALTGAPDAVLAAALHERTGGNPLLVRLVGEDLARRPGGLAALMAERPHLRRLVVGRLAPLSAAARALTDTAAVLGERVPVALLGAMAGLPPGDARPLLDEAAAAGVLASDGREVWFGHALVRDATYAELPATRRADLHRAAALALEGAGRPELAGLVASHWQRASGADAAHRCLTWAERAAGVARAALSPADAARFARLAVDSARTVGVAPAELARLLLRQAEALATLADVGTCLGCCEEAAALAEGAGDPVGVARAALVIHGTGDPAVLRAVRRLAERALAAVPDEEQAVRARLTAQLAVCRAEGEEPGAAAALAADALAQARRSGDDEALLEAIAARHLTISVPELVGERLDLGREAVALGARARRPMGALWGHLWRADAALQLGTLAAAERELAEIDRVAREHASPLARWHHHRFAAVLHQLAGRFAEARAEDDAAFGVARRMEDVSMMGMHVAFRVDLAALAGDPQLLPDDWETFVREGPPLPLVRTTPPLVHAVQGRLEHARAEFAEFRGLWAYRKGPRWYGTVGQLATLVDLLDDAEVAERLYPVLLPVARYYGGDGTGAVYSHGANARLVGDLARLCGRTDDAVRHYAEAVAMNDRIGARPAAALSRLGWARTLAAEGTRLAAANELATVAAAEFRRLGMPGPLAVADATLGAVQRSRREASPLSARENEVAALVADALSNRQIADRLVLSERTVESHVRSILTKLGFSSRTEIATWALRERMTP